MPEFGQLTEVIFKDSDYQILKMVGVVVQRQRDNLNENQETKNWKVPETWFDEQRLSTEYDHLVLSLGP